MKHYVAEIKCGLFPDRKEHFSFGFALVKIVNQLFAGSSNKAPQVRTKRAYSQNVLCWRQGPQVTTIAFDDDMSTDIVDLYKL